VNQIFRRGPSVSLRLGLLVLASVTLMTLDHRYERLEPARASLQLLFYPVPYVAELPARLFGWVNINLRSQQQLRQELRELREENLLLNMQVQQYNALSVENLRLSALLGSLFQLEQEQRVLIARIIQIELDRFNHTIMLNRGSSDEVYRGQPLLSAKGVIGQVIHASRYRSEALLITDPSHAIPVKSNRNGVIALAVGTGKSDELSLSFLPNTVDLEAGDLLITSGLGGLFPEGYPVARVRQVTRNPGAPFAEVIATPTGELGRVHEVLLLWPEAPSQPHEQATEATVSD